MKNCHLSNLIGTALATAILSQSAHASPPPTPAELVKILASKRHQFPSCEVKSKVKRTRTPQFYETSGADKKANPAESEFKTTLLMAGTLRKLVSLETTASPRFGKPKGEMRSSVLYGGKESMYILHTDSFQKFGSEAAYTKPSGSGGDIGFTAFLFDIDGQNIDEIVAKGTATTAWTGNLLEVRGKSKNGWTFQVTLDPTKDWLITATNFLGQDGLTALEGRLLAAEKRDGIWIPTQAQASSFIAHDGKQVRIQVSEWNLTSFEVRKVTASEMELIPKQKTLVNEISTGKNYHLINGKKVYVEPVEDVSKSGERLLGIAVVGSIAGLTAIILLRLFRSRR